MTVVTLYPTGDSEFQDDNPTLNNGLADSLGSGDENISDTQYRSVIKFDLTELPVGVIIKGVSLKLTISIDRASDTRTKRIYRVTSAWTETGVTWNNQPSYSGELGTLSMGASESGQKTFTLSAIEVAKMYDGTYTDRGFFIKTDTENEDFYAFHSRENATPSNKPQLVIDYTEMGGGALLML